ncbi:MAG: hypothetical protein KDA96_16010 [Planctomycetaceae bacterium]|nr:hypothetical protein [Planctomycetaceae bacterium]
MTESLEVRSILSGTGVSSGLLAETYLTPTGQSLDLGIAGDGFFVMRTNEGLRYTRSGTFAIEPEDNYIVRPGNGVLLRANAQEPWNSTNAVLQATGDPRIYFPLGHTVSPEATSLISFDGNLPASATSQEAEVWRTKETVLEKTGREASHMTLLNDLLWSRNAFTVGDRILIDGADQNGSVPVIDYIDVDGTTTVGDLIDALSIAFPNTRFRLNWDGYLLAEAPTAGPSRFELWLANRPGNFGSLDFTLFRFVQIRLGKYENHFFAKPVVHDARGVEHGVFLDFSKQFDGTWNVNASLDPSEGFMLDPVAEGLMFTSNGEFNEVRGAGLGDEFITCYFYGRETYQPIRLDFGRPGYAGGITERGDTYHLTWTTDGQAAGELSDLYFNIDGTLYGRYSNGDAVQMAQLMLATFPNPDGLLPAGDGTYLATPFSGEPELGTALSGDFGMIRSGFLNGNDDPYLPGSAVTRPLTHSVTVDSQAESTVIRWQRAAGTAEYDLWLQDLTRPDRPVLRVRRNTPKLELSSRYFGSAYRLWIRSINVYGQMSAWSSSRDIVLTDAPELHAVRGAVSTRPAVFEWTAPRDGLTHEIWLTNADTGKRVVWEKNLLGEKYVFSDLLPYSTYHVWVRSRRWDGSFTKWSAAVEFRPQPEPVAITTSPLPSVDATPTIAWRTMSAAQSYEVYVAEAGRSAAVYRQFNVFGNEHRITQPLSPGTYDLWVRAHFANGDASLWGQPTRIEIGTPPVLSVDNGILNWSVVNGATQFELWIDYGGGALAAKARVIHYTTLTNSRFVLPSTLPRGNYTAWVRALRSETGDTYRSRWSQAVSFDVS